jgi:hypothetical protein
MTQQNQDLYPIIFEYWCRNLNTSMAKIAKKFNTREEVVTSAQTFGLRNGWQWHYFKRPDPESVRKFS